MSLDAFRVGVLGASDLLQVPSYHTRVTDGLVQLLGVDVATTFAEGYGIRCSPVPILSLIHI